MKQEIEFRNQNQFIRLGSNSKYASDHVTNEFVDFNYNKIQLLVLEDEKLTCTEKLNPKNARIYSRVVKWMFEALYALDIEEKIRNIDPYKIGIYVAGPGYVIPWDVIRSRSQGETMSESMRKFFNPKHGFKYNLGIAPAHLSIQFGIKGPTNAFWNYPYAGKFAFQKAHFDLSLGAVELAIVLVCNIFEDPGWISYQNFHCENASRLGEGIFATILHPSKDEDLNLDFFSKRNCDYGFLSNLKATSL